jgi:hypothetical protein
MVYRDGMACVMCAPIGTVGAKRSVPSFLAGESGGEACKHITSKVQYTRTK